MGEKAEYRSAKRSRRLIREAFLQLFQEKKLSKITVKDIVDRADVNRSTFYAHYPDVRGVMEEIENEIIGEMFETLEVLEYGSFFKNPTPLLLKVSRYLEDDQDFYRVLWSGDGADNFVFKLQDLFTDSMEKDESIPENVRESQQFRLRITYFAGGIANMYRQWFRGTLDCSLNDIATEVGTMIAQSSADA